MCQNANILLKYSAHKLNSQSRSLFLLIFVIIIPLQFANSVIGVELVAEAVEDAKKNAELNSMLVVQSVMQVLIGCHLYTCPMTFVSPLQCSCDGPIRSTFSSSERQTYFVLFVLCILLINQQPIRSPEIFKTSPGKTGYETSSCSKSFGSVCVKLLLSLLCSVFPYVLMCRRVIQAFFAVFCQSVIHEEFKYIYVFIDKEVCHRYVVINYYLVVMTQMLALFDF